MDPVECWDSHQTIEEHMQHLINLGIKRIRIFLNIQYIPFNPKLKENSSMEDWRLFINHCLSMMPRGYDCWDNFSKNWWAGPEVNGHDSEIMKDIFIACKKYGLEPIVCMGASEETIVGSWLTRIPSEDKWNWLERFSQEFARYLKNHFRFIRADLEGYNEANELQVLGFGVDKYCDLMVKLFTGWKSISPNYKTHLFSCNIKEQDYLDYLLGNASNDIMYIKKCNDLLKVTDYISTHILTDEEWDYHYIDAVNYKLANYPVCKKYNIKQTLLEISPISHKDFELFKHRFNEMRGKVAMYGMVFIFKNEIVHTGDLDEIITYDMQTGTIIGIANQMEQPKYNFIKQFNKEVYNMYEDERNYNIPLTMETFANALGLSKKSNYSPYLPVLSAYFFGNNNYYHKPEQLLSKKDFDSWVEGMLNLLAKVKVINERINIWYDENGNYRTTAQRETITKSNPK
jgi:hypothetical protein